MHSFFLRKGEISRKHARGQKSLLWYKVNDAPALMRYGAGVLVCTKGADIAKASADVVLLKDDIEMVAIAREIADKPLWKNSAQFQ